MSEERGAITSIRLKNFVTYNNVVVEPRRHLNIMLGSDGTGKSMIVCAIVICFGGKPKLIGRSSTIGAYVKHGKKVAKVKIEMKDTGDETITIERTFDVDNHSSWKVNGKEANAKDIQDLTRSFNIQVDNLCQLLSQDKVQDFSKMNPQELLHNTEKSVGYPRLLEFHEQLKEFRRNEKNVAATVENKKRLLASERQKYEGMKEIVNSIEAKKAMKKAIMEKIVSLRQKRVWICYDQSRLQLVEAQKDRDYGAEEMQKLDIKLKAMKQEIKKLEAEMKQLPKSAEAHNTQMATRLAKLVRLRVNIFHYRKEIESVVDDQKFRVQAEENRDQEINIMVVQKNKHENDLQRAMEDIGSGDLITAQRRIQRILKDSCKKFVEYNEILADAFKHEMQNVESQLELEMRKQKFDAKVKESEELRDSRKNIEELLLKLDKALEPLILVTKELYTTAMTHTNRINPQNPAFEPFNTAFANLPKTVEDIDAELEVAQANVNCKTETAKDDKILDSYESTLEAIERLEQEIEELGVQQGTIMEQIDEMRVMWLNPLRELIHRINVNFSSYFSMMGCTGEVTVREADNIHDYDQYSLIIRVKFRDAEELQELTPQRQSEGERTVATAVFMLALQELSTFPFRCIDEIDQGMDSTNERRLIELVIKITAPPQTSQYFLLASKLLPGVEYGDHVNVSLGL